jgi:transposase-like protein
MRRKRHSPGEVVRKLREAEADLASGTALDQVCKKLGVSEATYHRWRKQYGGAGADEVKRLKELEKENARLKAIVADLELDKRILKEALEGNY